MARLSRLTSGEVKHGALQVGMLLEQIEKRYAADMYSPNMAAAFVLYLIKKSGIIDVANLSEFVKEQLHDKLLIDWIKRHIEEHWNDFRRLIAQLPIEWLREYILTHQPSTPRESYIATPECLCDLVIELMKKSKCARVLDPCCGIGNFMLRFFSGNIPCFFEGYDLSEQCICISRLRANVRGIDVSLVNSNTLEGETAVLGNFDLIFVEPPLGQRLTHINMFFNNQEGALPPAFPIVKSTNSTEWIWAAKMLDALNDNGHIVIILSNGALANMTEAPLRQYFIDRGYIESVIALPERMLCYAGISLSMVIISQKRNDFVKMIDATELYERGSRVNIMTVLHRSVVVEAFNMPSKYRRDILNTEIARNNYQLSVQRYFMPEITIDNGKSLSELCHVITRGVPLSRDELYEMRMDVNTGVRCLAIADIQDGVIGDTMPFISYIKANLQKYVAESGDVVLTKAMSPYKVAVVEAKEGIKILATANFFILKLRRELINPYYLMAYLRSNTGKAQLEQIATGTTLSTIGQEALEKILIPMRPMYVQEMFAKEYREKLEKLASLRQEYELLKGELDSVYDNFDKEIHGL